MTKDRGIPIMALVIGAGAWGVLWYPLRALAHAGLGGVWLTLVLFAGAALSAGALGIMRGPWRGPWAVCLALGVLGGVTNIGFVVAVLHDNILRVTLLFYLSPVWSVLLARLFLKERLDLIVILGVAGALVGAGVLVWQPGAIMFRWADALALLAGFSFAGANIVLRAYPALSMETKLLSTFVGVVLVAVLVLALNREPMPGALPLIWIWAALLGAIGLFGMTWFVQYGVTVLPVRQSAVILLSEVITAAFSQHVFLHRTLGVQAWVGAAIIAAAATLVATRAA